MAIITGKCKDILDKTELVAIVTQGPDGPHLVATWGDYVRALGVAEGRILAIPAGGYKQTEDNLRKNSRMEIVVASRQVPGPHGPGCGVNLRGRGSLQTEGEFATRVKAKFPWARGALVFEVEEVVGQV